MQASIILVRTAVIGGVAVAALLAPSRTQATSMIAAANLKTAIHEITVTHKVPYTCRRGPSGRECYYVSPADRNPRYERPNGNAVNPYYQPRPYVGPGPYDYHHWGGPDAPD
jgi:hypothetical protein